MNKKFEAYRFTGNRFVEGWLELGTLAVIKGLDSAQRSKGISGAVAEIGVHHGRLFIGLDLLQRDTENSLAIDLFEDQELNVDRSGKGDLARFRKNLARWSRNDRVVIHQGDSTLLDAASVRALVNSDIRFFSIDGGHTDSIVFSDMTLAESVLCLGGIVIADDFFNEWWPGVASGTFRYMKSGGLRPFAVGFNKVFFATPDYALFYFEALESYLENRYPLVVKRGELGGHDVLVIGRNRPRTRQLISRNKTLKGLYHRVRA